MIFNIYLNEYYVSIGWPYLCGSPSKDTHNLGVEIALGSV